MYFCLKKTVQHWTFSTEFKTECLDRYIYIYTSSLSKLVKFRFHAIVWRSTPPYTNGSYLPGNLPKWKFIFQPNRSNLEVPDEVCLVQKPRCLHYTHLSMRRGSQTLTPNSSRSLTLHSQHSAPSLFFSNNLRPQKNFLLKLSQRNSWAKVHCGLGYDIVQHAHWSNTQWQVAKLFSSWHADHASVGSVGTTHWRHPKKDGVYKE